MPPDLNPGPLPSDPQAQIERLSRRAKREREARKHCEAALENRSRELYDANQALTALAETLEAKVELRTSELAEAVHRAESATRSKTAFLATMSHELRTPMNGVLGMAQLLLDSPLDAEQRDHARAIVSCGELLLSLINDILDFSKVEAGKMELENEPFSPAESLHSVQATVRDAARRRAVTLRFVLGEDVPAMLVGDDMRLRQILLNLLSNAIKFAPGGHVDVRLSRAPTLPGVDATDRADTCALLLEVKDDGRGIEASRVASIFEPFVQEQASTAREFGGTGLGLAISQRIAQLMGGGLEVESQSGQGAIFRLRWMARIDRSEDNLRQAQAVDAGHPVDAAPGVAPESLRLLVAEDNPVNQAFLMTLLRRLGVKADLAEDGPQTWERLQSNTYDVVLMDMQMPGLTGIEVTRLLRARPELHQPRIVAVTANVFEEDRQACIDAGMQDFLGKPFRLDALSKILGIGAP